MVFLIEAVGEVFLVGILLCIGDILLVVTGLPWLPLLLLCRIRVFCTDNWSYSTIERLLGISLARDSLVAGGLLGWG